MTQDNEPIQNNELPLAATDDPEAMLGLTATDVGKILLTGTSTLAAISAGFVISLGHVGASRGATASTRVQWQQRQAEIRHVIAEADLQVPIIECDE